MRAAAALALLAGCATTSSPPPPASAPPPPSLPVHVEPVRLSGELPPAPASAGPPGTIVEGRYEVCLDNGGRVASVKPLHGIAGADAAVETALHSWSWFVVFHETAPACFATTVRLAVPGQSRILRQAGAAVTANVVHNVMAPPPAWLTTAYAGQLIDGVYKVCVGDNGVVHSVRPVTGVPGADDVFIAGLHASSWDVLVGPLAQAPFCFAAPVRLDERHAAPSTDVPPPLPYPPEIARPERGVSIVLLVHKLAGDPPPRALTGAYRRCIMHDGTVATVEPLPGATADRETIDALRGGRYELRGPAGVGVCEVTAPAHAATR